MKNIASFIFLLALLVSGCNQEEMLKDGTTSVSGKGRTFTTEFEQNDSRTYVENGLYSRWTEGDFISLFDASTLNLQYLFDGETGDTGGTFFMFSQPEGTGTALNANYAVYPYSKDVKMTEDGVISVTLPSEQHYAENSYGLGDNTMVAVTEDVDDTFLSFKNVGGCLKLQLYGDDVTVKSITLKGNNGEKIAGKATITPTYGEAPTVSMAADATETITLDCGEKGVKLGTTEETATSFWMVVPPTTFDEGFTVTVTDIKGYEFVQSTPNEVAIKRNVISLMSVLVVDNTPYLTFIADSEQTFTISKSLTTLEYSVNGGEWNKLGTTIVTFGDSYGSLRLRGKRSMGTANSAFDYAYFIFGNGTKVKSSGDIRTLIDYENYIEAETKKACFSHLFYNCSVLTSSPSLPSTRLAIDCYSSMFANCTSLQIPPDLPAVEMKESCYSFMFKNCTSLEIPPKIFATKLAFSCFNNMFENCSKLECAPDLYAIVLAPFCYQSMFYGCVNLVSSPILSAVKLSECCYCSMFKNCSQLNNITMLATDVSADGCLLDWVVNIASTGTFVKAKLMESLSKGDNGIPKGWTIKNYGEE